MPVREIPLVKEVGRVPSMIVALDAAQEKRFQRLLEDHPMVDMHEHVLVLPANIDELRDYVHAGKYRWGYEAVKHGGWTAVGTSNGFRGRLLPTTGASAEFQLVVDEVGMMITDLSLHGDIAVKVSNADEILAARQQGKMAFFPTVEHLCIGNQIHRVDVLYGMGVRLAGLTYSWRTYIGDGCYERTDAGLSDFGIEVVHRMNEVGMAVDLSHAGQQTALDAIEHSHAPTIFSHNASHTLRPTKRTVRDEALKACVAQGGIVCITAVPNSLSDDPQQDINCVLDHYDYMVKLVGADAVGIGTDTLIGDHVAFSARALGRTPCAPYLNGLESPADGKNIVRGLIARGHSDADIAKIMGGNALAYMRRVLR